MQINFTHMLNRFRKEGIKNGLDVKYKVTQSSSTLYWYSQENLAASFYWKLEDMDSIRP